MHMIGALLHLVLDDTYNTMQRLHSAERRGTRWCLRGFTPAIIGILFLLPFFVPVQEGISFIGQRSFIL